MPLSERFTDEKSILQMKILWHDNWPCHHACMDGFFDHPDALFESLKDERFAWLVSRIAGTEPFTAVSPPTTHTLDPGQSTDPSDHMGRIAGRWSRILVTLFLTDPWQGDHGGWFEIWKNPPDIDLIHWFPPNPGRIVLSEIRPDLYYGLAKVTGPNPLTYVQMTLGSREVPSFWSGFGPTAVSIERPE